MILKKELSIDELSKVGFGAYRITTENVGHKEALQRALEAGCNLIDTSANYTNGRSEELIGQVTRELDVPVFVVTKGGYVQNNNLQVLADLQKRGLAIDDVVHLKKDFKHSIHPDFLQSQIDLSRRRLKKERLDVFLLHNPEYFFRQPDVTQEEYYRRIEQACLFLESKVDEGVIRYYGISSNTFGQSTALPDTTDLSRVLLIVNALRKDHHFKFIEFPYNLVEDGATREYNDRSSLVTQAKAHRIVTLANRPLNMSVDGKPLRLATYHEEIRVLNTKEDQQLFDSFVNVLRNQLKEMGSDVNIDEIQIITHLSKSWMNVGNPEGVEKLFYQHLIPFLQVIYENDIPVDVTKHFEKLLQRSILYSRKNMTQNALEFAKGRFANVFAGDEPLAVAATRHYLQKGIDHVLVGMRSKRYVNELAECF